ncbi:MAG TPA: hypothetical protein VGD80_35635 [Kofleriaceae bacterium]|jgi:hypothetical protein
MSNLLTPVEHHLLAAVTGGTGTSTTSTKTANAPTPRASGSNDDLVKQLTALSDTIKDIGNVANKTGFSTTEVLMLGMILNQNRGVNVFVRHW